MLQGSKLIFVSHAAIDAEIASALKKCLETVFAGCQVFVSSDPEDLPPGEEWPKKILEALELADCILVIATERGLSRKWVWFEAGRAWFSGVPCFICCAGSMRKTNLPTPFSNRMALNIDEQSDLDSLLQSLVGHLGVSRVSIDLGQLANNIVRCGVRAEETSQIHHDPFTAEILDDIRRKMSQLAPAQIATIRAFAIYETLTTIAAKQHAAQSGANMEQWTVPSDLVTRTGWLIASPTNTWDDLFGHNSFSVNPTIKPYLKTYFHDIDSKQNKPLKDS